jgi:hypothetical protein
MGKDDPRFDVVLDASDPQFAEKLVEALGLQPGEQVEIITPQFDRTDGVWPVVPTFDFANLPSYPDATLRALGCQPWDEPDENGETLWLFPAEWYDRIPEGHIVVDINGEEEPFRRGVTDDDRRVGALAYGFKKRAALSTQDGASVRKGRIDE